MPVKGATRPKVACPDCGKVVGSVASHRPFCVNRDTAASVTATTVVEKLPDGLQIRSRRGRQRYQEAILRPIDQIPMPPGGGDIEATGAWAYYLHPEGATITDALTLYPNGGVPDVDDPRLRARYGENHLYYQQRMAQKGFEFVGQTLTEAGIRRLIEILGNNREDEILFCEDEIANCHQVISGSDRPEIRDQARKRRRQFEQRLEYLSQPLNPEELTEELNEIARAQMLAKVDPNVLRVMRSMIGEVNDRMAMAITKFQGGNPRTGAAPASLSARGSDATIFDATGKDHIEL